MKMIHLMPNSHHDQRLDKDPRGFHIRAYLHNHIQKPRGSNKKDAGHLQTLMEMVSSSRAI